MPDKSAFVKGLLFLYLLCIPALLFSQRIEWSCVDKAPPKELFADNIKISVILILQENTYKAGTEYIAFKRPGTPSYDHAWERISSDLKKKGIKNFDDLSYGDEIQDGQGLLGGFGAAEEGVNKRMKENGTEIFLLYKFGSFPKDTEVSAGKSAIDSSFVELSICYLNPDVKFESQPRKYYTLGDYYEVMDHFKEAIRSQHSAYFLKHVDKKIFPKLYRSFPPDLDRSKVIMLNYDNSTNGYKKMNSRISEAMAKFPYAYQLVSQNKLSDYKDNKEFKYVIKRAGAGNLERYYFQDLMTDDIYIGGEEYNGSYEKNALDKFVEAVTGSGAQPASK